MLTSTNIVDRSEDVGGMGEGYECGFGGKKWTTGTRISRIRI